MRAFRGASSLWGSGRRAELQCDALGDRQVPDQIRSDEISSIITVYVNGIFRGTEPGVHNINTFPREPRPVPTNSSHTRLLLFFSWVFGLSDVPRPHRANVHLPITFDCFTFTPRIYHVYNSTGLSAF